MQPLELDPEPALQEIVSSLAALRRWAGSSRVASGIRCVRHWNRSVGTYTYHTTAVVEQAEPGLLEKVATLFFHANDLEAQPWYAQFESGYSEPASLCLPEEVRAASIGQARFDFGLGQDRYYDQLIALMCPDANTHVVALRSITGLPDLEDAVRAYTLSPTADVFEQHEDRLWWHHIVTTNGAALFSPSVDRLFMNVLRLLRLDGRERRTYLDEARGFVDFCHTGGLDALLRTVADASAPGDGEHSRDPE